MKKTTTLSITCFFISLILLAQKSPVKYGEIPLDDLKMTVYDKDSSASAVILSDYGEAYVVINSVHASLNFERHVRIKILKNEGLHWADVEIPLYESGASEEKVVGLKASSYNLENGKIAETRMDKDGVFKEKFNRFLNLQKFTIPNVKEGSVIEYSYKVVSDFLDNFPNWQFQYDIPSRRSEYWAIIPEFFVFEKYMQGYIHTAQYEIKNKPSTSYSEKAHHWIMGDVPAFKEEPYMTCEQDYVSKMHFALSHINFPGQPTQEIMGSWSKLNTSLLESESFGKIITGSGFLKKTAQELTANLNDPLQKVSAIYDYVKNTLEWNGTKDYYADPPKKIFEAKKGTAADINLALASMLEKIGIEADPVLLSTRDHGFVRQSYPMARQFNYVVCSVVVEGKRIFLDATERYLPINVLPERCLNGQGLIISKYRHGWIDLQTKAKARTVVTADMVLNEAGALKGKLNFIREGYDAHQMRKEYSSKGEETYLKDFISAKSWQLEKSEFKDLQSLDAAAKENYEVNIPEHVTVAGDVMYINPFLTSQIQSNPFKLEKREYPVDFGTAQEKVYILRFPVPEGYTVDELPKSKVVALPGGAGKYLYNAVFAGNMVSVTSNFSVNKSLFIQGDEYLILREFYNQVVAKQAEQIVLKKK